MIGGLILAIYDGIVDHSFGIFDLLQDGWGGEWVSRRVGELALEQVSVGRPGGAPHALNDLDAPR